MVEIYNEDVLDKPRDECGVIGIFLTLEGEQALYQQGRDMRQLLYDGLKAQHHRGHQNTGAGVSIDGESMAVIYGAGRPEKAFNDGEAMLTLPPRGRFGIGHNRYTTSGGADGAQPVKFKTERGDFVLAHNGNFYNQTRLVREAVTSTDELPSDSWVHGSVVADYIDQKWTAPGALIKSSKLSEGAFSFTAFNDHEIVGMRDPRGMRPLVLGRLGTYGWMLASETPTLKAVDAQFVREIQPGELVVINSADEISSIQYAQTDPRSCVMEGVYLSSPDHLDTGQKRYASGRYLAREAPVEADMVVPILGTAKDAANGYAHELKLKYVEAITKIKDVRSFMAAAEESRKHMVRGKLAFDLDAMRDKKVVIIEDSAVRGNTLEVVCEILAPVVDELHIRIASPAFKGQCFYGVDIATNEELIMNRMSQNDFRRMIGANSLEYLSMTGLKAAFGDDICTGCLDGNYPTDVPVQLNTRRAAVRT